MRLLPQPQNAPAAALPLRSPLRRSGAAGTSKLFFGTAAAQFDPPSAATQRRREGGGSAHLS